MLSTLLAESTCRILFNFLKPWAAILLSNIVQLLLLSNAFPGFWASLSEFCILGKFLLSNYLIWNILRVRCWYWHDDGASTVHSTQRPVEMLCHPMPSRARVFVAGLLAQAGAVKARTGRQDFNGVHDEFMSNIFFNSWGWDMFYVDICWWI